MKRYACLLLLIFAVSVNGLHAQNPAGIMDLADDSAKVSKEEIDKEKNKKLDFSFHGFVRANIAAEKDDFVPDANVGFKNSGVILQLQFEGYASDVAHLYAAVNLELNQTEVEKLDQDDLYNVGSYLKSVPFLKFVEAYMDIYPADWMSIRAGYQIITWGEIEGIEAPTDILTPWDYTTTSTTFEDARIANTAVALNFNFAKQKLELVWIPIFQPSVLPTKDILDKGKTDIFTVVPKLERPPMTIENCEYAARLSGQIGKNFRYGVAFLYGFDDLPDSEVAYDTLYNSVQHTYSGNTGTIEAYLVYRRVMIPTLDLAVDIQDKVAIKASGALFITDDFEGERDDHRNSYVKYLVGVESTNIGADIYLGLYAGQQWIINYTEQHDARTTTSASVKHNLISNDFMMQGFDEEYPYKWLVSCLVQRSFLPQRNLDVGVRFALSTSPDWSAIDYIVNVNFQLRIVDGVSTTLGFVFADKIDVIKNMGILEFQYSF